MIDAKTFELIFKAFDTDASGAVTKDEMLPFVKASLEAAQEEMEEDYDDEEEEEYDPEEQEDIKQILDDHEEELESQDARQELTIQNEQKKQDSLKKVKDQVEFEQKTLEVKPKLTKSSSPPEKLRPKYEEETKV